MSAFFFITQAAYDALRHFKVADATNTKNIATFMAINVAYWKQEPTLEKRQITSFVVLTARVFNLLFYYPSCFICLERNILGNSSRNIVKQLCHSDASPKDSVFWR